MKPNFSLRHTAALLATLLLPTLAEAHPGHSAFDWTVLPHNGHTSEHAVFFSLLALTAIGCVAHWMATRKR